MKHEPTEAAPQVVEPIDDEGLRRLRELYEAATPGEWGAFTGALASNGLRRAFVQPLNANGEFDDIVAEMPGKRDCEDADYIAALHNAFPAMCARIEADGRRARHKDDVVVYRLDGGREPIWCVHCSRQAYYVVDSATGSLLTCGQHLLSAVRRQLA